MPGALGSQWISGLTRAAHGIYTTGSQSKSIVSLHITRPFGPSQLRTIYCGTCEEEVIPDKQNVGSIAVAPMKAPAGLGLKIACVGVEVDDHPEPSGFTIAPNTTPPVIISSCTPVKKVLEYPFV